MTKPITVELLLLKKDGSGLRIRLSDARCFSLPQAIPYGEWLGRVRCPCIKGTVNLGPADLRMRDVIFAAAVGHLFVF